MSQSKNQSKNQNQSNMSIIDIIAKRDSKMISNLKEQVNILTDVNEDMMLYIARLEARLAILEPEIEDEIFYEPIVEEIVDVEEIVEEIVDVEEIVEEIIVEKVKKSKKVVVEDEDVIRVDKNGNPEFIINSWISPSGKNFSCKSYNIDFIEPKKKRR